MAAYRLIAVLILLSALPSRAHGPMPWDLAAWIGGGVFLAALAVFLLLCTVVGQYRIVRRLFRMKTGLAWVALFYFAYGWVGIFLYREMLLGGAIGSLLAYGWVLGPTLYVVVEWFERRGRLKDMLLNEVTVVPPFVPPGQAPESPPPVTGPRKKSPLEI